MTGGFGAGFFGKLSNIQDENRQQEKEFLMEDYREFNKSLSVYRANKQKQTEEDNKARGFAMQIAGDPRDTKALDVARSFINSGHNITDPVVLAQAKSMWGGIKLKDAAGVVEQAQSQQAPGLGGTDPAAQQPGQAPTDTPAGIMNKPVLNAKSIFLGKSSPEQLAQKSTQNIAGRTGMTAQQVQDIKTGADTGRSAFQPNSQMTPLDPAAAMLMQSAAKIAADPKNLKDPAAFWGAISKGDYVGAGKFIASVEEQNAWHIKAAEIQAAATIKGHQISADATVQAAGIRNDNNVQAQYNESVQKLDDIKSQLGEGSDVVTPYLAQYPGIDIKKPEVQEWIALQELKKQDTGAYQRVIAGPSNKTPSGVNAVMDPRLSNTPPGYKTTGKGEPPKPTTDPYDPKGTPKPDMAKSVAEKIKAITDPDNKAKITKEYIAKYGKDAAVLHGLTVEDEDKPTVAPGLQVPGANVDKSIKTEIPQELIDEDARTSSTKNKAKFDKDLKATTDDAKALIDSGVDFETAVKDAVKNAKKLKRNITETQIRQALKK